MLSVAEFHVCHVTKGGCNSGPECAGQWEAPYRISLSVLLSQKVVPECKEEVTFKICRNHVVSCQVIAKYNCPNVTLLAPSWDMP